jgi:predicted Fe-Mo cluster-binding NifX family protein
MKLCIPIQEGEGASAVVCGHFGRAPAFVLYDPQGGTYETLPNPKAEHEHGQCKPMELLADRGIAAMLCRGMGRNAIAAIERVGIKVFRTSGTTVGEAIEEFMKGHLLKLDAATACTGHNCH